ncbi:elongation factor 2-like protein [Tanacetum coccineum]
MVTLGELRKIMDCKHDIRNMSVIAHVNHGTELLSFPFLVIYQSGPFVDAFLLTGKSTLTNTLVAAASVIVQEVDGDASMTNTCDDEPRRHRTIKSTAYIFLNPLLDKKLMFLNPCIYVLEPVHICSQSVHSVLLYYFIPYL